MPVYIDPTSATNGAGTLGNPRNTWAGISWVANETYLQRSDTTWVGGVGVGAAGVTLGSYDAATGSATTTKAILDGTGTTRTITNGANDDVTIQDIEILGGTTGANRRCIGAGSTGDYAERMKMRRLICRRVAGDGSTDCNAIFVQGNDVEVTDCVVYDIADDGIWIEGARPLVQRCRVYQIGLSGRVAGDCIQLAGGAALSCANFVVTDNYLDHSDNINKQAFICSGASSGAGGVFERNTIIGPASMAGTFVGAICDQPGSTIRRNTLTSCRTGIMVQASVTVVGNLIVGGVNGLFGSNLGSTAANAKFWNNSVVGMTDYGAYLESGSSSAALQNNLFLTCAKGSAAPSTVTRSGNLYKTISTGQFSDWIGAAGTAEVYATSDPLLSSEYRPMEGSPLFSGGVDLGYLRDIKGKQGRRFVGAYGIAAFRRIA